MKHDIVFMTGIDEGFPTIERVVVEQDSEDPETLLELFKEFCFDKGIKLYNSKAYYEALVETVH
jgi:hypothetical protein